MRPVSYSAVFIAHAVVGIFVLAAPARAVISISGDTTVNTDASGDPGGATPDDDVGGTGGAAVIWQVPDADVLFNSGFTFTGGVGGDGGFDAANDGGNLGGAGGNGFHIWQDGGTATASGIFVYGGSGGSGSNGGTGGANDTGGGAGGAGGLGIYGDGLGIQITLTDSTVEGGVGGSGGSAGDAAGDASDAAAAGDAADGGMGIVLNGTTDAVVSLTNTTVSGGAGGEGGVSLANATNAHGGDGGAGIVDLGASTLFTLGAGSVVQGGDGGAVGVGGAGGNAGIDGVGVSLQGVGASLINHGAILGSDADAPAALFVGGDTALIDNYGTIGATSNHAGYAVYASADLLATFHNRPGALVQSTATYATMVTYSSITSFINEGSIINSGGAVGLSLQGGVGSFVNSGTIQSNNSSAIDIANAAVANLIDNTGGLITNSGGSNAAVTITTDLGAGGITFQGGEIANTGGFAAIRVFASQTATIALDDVTINGGVLFDNDAETLNVSGATIDGDVEFAGGVNNLNFLSGGTTTLLADAQFLNADFFSLLAGADVVSNAEQSDANSSIGQLTTIVGATLTLNEDFWADEEVLNQGAIEIAAGKVLTTNVLSGAGHYVFGVTDEATLAKIEGQGTGSLLDFADATFEIKLTDPSSMLVAGTNLLVAEDLQDNAVQGLSDGALADDNSALLSFLLYRGDAPEIGLTSDLLFVQVQLALLADIASHGDDPNAVALGGALDIIGLDGDADLDDLMLALAQLPTDADINEVLDSLLPETDGVAYDIATDAGDQVLDVASRRLDALRGVNVAAREYKLASAAPVGPGSGGAARYFWAQAFGRAVDQSKHDFDDGYDAGSYGFALGADTTLSGGKAQLGLAASYASTDADGNGVNRTDTTVDSYQLTLYGDRVFADGIYAKGLLAYGWHQNDIVRHDVGGVPANNASGAYDASQLSARVELGRAFAAGRRLTLIPHLTLSYATYDPDGYTETGVGGLGLTVVGDSLESLRVGAGLLARWDFALDGGGRLQPELRLSYRNELARDRFETTSEFLGAPGVAFRTQGVEPPADILNLGLGALLATAGGVDLRASYDLELKEDYVAHGGYVRASLPF
jgi:outer membrane autotransporter protein